MLSLNLTELQQEQKMGALKNKMAVWSKCVEQFLTRIMYFISQNIETAITIIIMLDEF